MCVQIKEGTTINVKRNNKNKQGQITVWTTKEKLTLEHSGILLRNVHE